jgi:hypothetical protein
VRVPEGKLGDTDLSLRIHLVSMSARPVPNICDPR